MKASTSGRPSTAANAATSTRNSTIRMRKRRDLVHPVTLRRCWNRADAHCCPKTRRPRHRPALPLRGGLADKRDAHPSNQPFKRTATHPAATMRR